MKTLLILRHAKAEQASAGELDFDRDLSKRGKHDAEAVGRKLVEMNLVPRTIVSSAARRTRKTARRVAEAANFLGAVVETQDLYDAGIIDIVEVVHGLSPEADLALIVGHNPGLGDFVYKFGAAIQSFATATVAQLRLPIDAWHELEGSTKGELVWMWTPDSDES